jgi:hypothetical protein
MFHSLADTSGCSIECTMWGTIGTTEGAQLEQQMLADGTGKPVFVACKGVCEQLNNNNE